jgi:ABC-type multidrug transport system fused ATPase/permease subunit
MFHKIRAAIHLVGISAKMSYKNVAVVLFSNLMSSLRLIALMILPAVILGLMQSNAKFFYIIVTIVLYAVITLISDSGSLAFRLLETAFGYTANNIAALRVGQNGMRIDYSKLEDSIVQNEHFRALSSTWIFSESIDFAVGNLVTTILLIVPSAFIISIIGSSSLLIIFGLVLLGIFNESAKKKTTHSLAEEKAQYLKRRNYVQRILYDPEYAKEIRLYKNLDFIIEKGSEAEANLLNIDKCIIKTENLHTVLSLLITAAELFVIYYYATNMFFAGELHIANFMLIISSIQMFTQGVKSFFSIFTEIGGLINYFGDYERYMSIETSDHEETYIRDGRVADYDIEFRNVSFKYPNSDDYALRNINLKISSARTIALVGENGSGKTTIIKLLCKLYEPSEGEILFNGIPIDNIDRESYLRFISPVFQDFKLHAFSLRENISFLENNDDLILSLFAMQNLTNLIGDNGLATYVGKSLSEDGRDYSGGERQMLAYIRAMYKSHNKGDLTIPLYVLDEPTSAIDPIAELRYFESLKKLTENNATALFVTHRMASAKFSDAIVVLANGQIVEHGSFNELINRNSYFAEMFNIQAQWYGNENTVG